MLPVLPLLKSQLHSDDEATRASAADLVARLLGASASGMAAKYPDVLAELLRRYADQSAGLRLQMLAATGRLAHAVAGTPMEQQVRAVGQTCVRARAGAACQASCCCAPQASSPWPLGKARELPRPTPDWCLRRRLLRVCCMCMCAAVQVLAAAHDRLQDTEERVRAAAAKALCDLMTGLGSSYAALPGALEAVAGRLRDKKLVVRKAALAGLLGVWRSCCTALEQGAHLFLHLPLRCCRPAWVCMQYPVER